jgi:hypothetical protein
MGAPVSCPSLQLQLQASEARLYLWWTCKLGWTLRKEHQRFRRSLHMQPQLQSWFLKIQLSKTWAFGE